MTACGPPASLQGHQEVLSSSFPLNDDDLFLITADS